MKTTHYLYYALNVQDLGKGYMIPQIYVTN